MKKILFISALFLLCGFSYAQLTVTANVRNVSCFGGANGSATITANGTPAYSFTWSPGGMTGSAIQTGLAAGSYTVQVRDASAATGSVVVVIGQPAQLTTINTQTNVICHGACTGAFNIIANGGTSPYTYTANSSFVPHQQNICAGIYSYGITDSNGCSSSGSITITQPPPNAMPNATLSAINYNETCYLAGDGAIDLSITGTNPGPFIYQWSNGISTQDINNITSGTYTVVVSDANQACASYNGSITAIGTNCGSISGNVFVDVNSDCINNGSDINIQNTLILVNPGNRFGYTDPSGNYSINNLPYGTYSVSVGSGSLASTCASVISSFVNAGNPNSVNNVFPLLQNASVQPDATVWASSTGIVPGFLSRINYSVQNISSLNASGQFKVIFPTAFIPAITNKFPAGSIQSGDTIIWNYNLAGYYSIMNTYIDFMPPVATPLGSTFTTCVVATTTVPDLNPLNNTFCYSRIVTGSFDPNDKTASPAGLGSAGNITADQKEHNYLIRFQNTGNGPAVNIVVKDTLSNVLDVSTFEMLSASHAYKIDILPGNVFRWKFDNIMLPDSNSNEPASHGYIHYRIRQKPNNPIGTQIKNTAYIYFDFNDPVVTNTALNTIYVPDPLSVQGYDKDGEWMLYPNPSTGLLHLFNASVEKETSSELMIANAIGQSVYLEKFTGFQKTIDLSLLPNGVYFIKLTSDKQSFTGRIVLSK